MEHRAILDRKARTTTNQLMRHRVRSHNSHATDVPLAQRVQKAQMDQLVQLVRLEHPAPQRHLARQADQDRRVRLVTLDAPELPAHRAPLALLDEMEREDAAHRDRKDHRDDREHRVRMDRRAVAALMANRAVPEVQDWRASQDAQAFQAEMVYQAVQVRPETMQPTARAQGDRLPSSASSKELYAQSRLQEERKVIDGLLPSIFVLLVAKALYFTSSTNFLLVAKVFYL
jgi:hypothetical protein